MKNIEDLRIRYIEKRINHLKELFGSELRSIDRATDIARVGMEKRLEGMNEFRQQLNDQAKEFITRPELNAIRKEIEADIRILRESKATLEGKADQKAVNIAMAISLIGLIIGVIAIIIHFIK